MNKQTDLRLKCLAIGSLPHKNVDEAIVFVEKTFSDIPFWPQLPKLSRYEDMIFQYLENMPGIILNHEKVYFDGESDEFFRQLETFFSDYEMGENLDNYKISNEFSATFKKYLDLIKRTKPSYAKGQIVGPFTLSTTLCDKDGKCTFYDETSREVVVKTLILKALWQIKEIKSANPTTTPIIFIDEPSISQLGTSAFITISKEEVGEILKEVSDKIKEAGALSAIHCCGKCNWTVPISIGINIINFDAYSFAQNFSLFHKELSRYLSSGGKIAWGIVPTLDSAALEGLNIDTLETKFETAVKLLEKKGVSRELILDNSLITPSCGAGALSIELAQKAMNLTKDLSQRLRIKYKN